MFTNPMGFRGRRLFLLADLIARPALRRTLSAVRRLRSRPGRSPALRPRRRSSSRASYLDRDVQLMMYLGFALVGWRWRVVSRSPAPALRQVAVPRLRRLRASVSFLVPGSPLGNNIGRFFMRLRVCRCSSAAAHAAAARRMAPPPRDRLSAAGHFGERYLLHFRPPRPRTRALLRARARARRQVLRPRLPVPRRGPARTGRRCTSRRRATPSRAAGTARRTPSTTASSTRPTRRPVRRWLRRHGRAVHLRAGGRGWTPSSKREPASRRLARRSRSSSTTRIGPCTVCLAAEPLVVAVDGGGKADVTAIGHASLAIRVQSPGAYEVKVDVVALLARGRRGRRAEPRP